MNNRVRELRQRKHWTVSELSRASGVGVGHISEIERGLKMPGILTAFRLVIDTVQPVLLARGHEPQFDRFYVQGELAFTRPQWGVDWSLGIRSRWQPGAPPAYGAFMLAAWQW